MSEDIKKISSLQNGMPTLALLAPRNYSLEIFEERYKLKIPIRGTFHDLDPDFFDKDTGEFELISDDNKTINVSMITKVLFAAKMYPDLKQDQLFCPISFCIVGDELEILGQVLSVLPNEQGD